jgi:hypothetical protein
MRNPSIEPGLASEIPMIDAGRQILILPEYSSGRGYRTNRFVLLHRLTGFACRFSRFAHICHGPGSHIA